MHQSLLAEREQAVGVAHADHFTASGRGRSDRVVSKIANALNSEVFVGETEVGTHPHVFHHFFAVPRLIMLGHPHVGMAQQ